MRRMVDGEKKDVNKGDGGRKVIARGGIVGLTQATPNIGQGRLLAPTKKAQPTPYGNPVTR